MENIIPVITDPLGKYWDQPDPKDILIDYGYAVMRISTFYKLQEYSTSIPSGKYPGKMWSAFINNKWYLKWYMDDPKNKDFLLIPCREILVMNHTLIDINFIENSHD